MEKQWNIILHLIFILEYFWIMDTELNMEYQISRHFQRIKFQIKKIKQPTLRGCLWIEEVKHLQ